MSPGSPPTVLRVFISYAWENQEYRSKVKALAVRLRADGIDARLDVWHHDSLPIPDFMSREMRNSDKVLILCSPDYKRKVHAMEDGEKISGVGWEHMLLTSVIWTGDKERAAFVPALFKGEWQESAPDFLSAVPRSPFSILWRATFTAIYCLRKAKGLK